MPRKTDSNNPKDWLWIAGEEMNAVCLLVEQEVGYSMCRGKLAEILEKILKAELIRLGWFLEKTHDLERLLDALVEFRSDLVDQVEPLCDLLDDDYFATRYPGFDFEDPDWVELRKIVHDVDFLLQQVLQKLK